MESALPEIARMLADPVATVERVQICKSGGARFAEPTPVAEHDSSGLPIELAATPTTGLG